MNQYTYFALGIVLGISLAVYYFMNREEKDREVELNLIRKYILLNY